MSVRIPNPKHSASLVSRFASEFVNRASSFIVFPLMIKYLSAEAYGVNTQIQTLSTYLLTLASLGLGFFVIREYSGNIEIKTLSARFRSSIFLVTVSSILVGSVFLLLPAQVNQLFFRVTWADAVIQWGFGLILFSGLEQVIRDFLRARLRMVAYSISQIMQAVIYVAGVSVILTTGGNLLQIIQLTVILRAASFLGMFIFLLVVREVELFGNFISLKEQMKIIRWGLPIVASSLSVSFLSNGDRALLGALTDSVSVGVYGAAYQLANVLLALGAPFWSMLYPLIATYKNSHDPSSLSRVSKRYSNAYAALGIPAFFGLLVIGTPTLGYFGRSVFEIPLHVFLFIMLGVFISQFCAPILYMAYVYQKPRTIFLITTISALVNLGSNYILIPYLGIFAPALNTTLTYTLMDYLLIRLIPSTGFKESELYDYANIFRYILAGVVMTIVLVIVSNYIQFNLVNLFLLIAGAAITYAITLFSLYRFSFSRMIKPLLG